MGNVQDSQDPFLHLSTYFTSKILKKNPNIHETVPVLNGGGHERRRCEIFLFQCSLQII